MRAGVKSIMNVTSEESNSDNMPAYVFCLFLGEGAQDDKE